MAPALSGFTCHKAPWMPRFCQIALLPVICTSKIRVIIWAEDAAVVASPFGGLTAAQ